MKLRSCFYIVMSGILKSSPEELSSNPNQRLVKLIARKHM